MIVKNNGIEIYMIKKVLIKERGEEGPNSVYKMACKDLRTGKSAGCEVPEAVGEKLKQFFDDIEYEVKKGKNE